MREIKFRSWCYHAILEKHVMRSYEEIKSNCLKYVTDNLVFKNREIMQFTGLKDKDGNEIYEGDILKGSNSVIYSVSFVDSSFMARVENKSFRHEYPLPFHLMDFQMSSIKVIGNVYENPEILDS